MLGVGKLYTVFYPDGTVEQRTMVGSPKLEGDTLKLRGRKWIVTRAVKVIGEEIDYELHVNVPSD